MSNENILLLENNKSLQEIKEDIANLLFFTPKSPNFFDIFTPSFPILMNVKKDSNKLPFACYTYELEDEYTKILDGLKLIGECISAGGGIGLDFSNIREINATINYDEKLKSKGIIPFIKLFEAIINTGLTTGVRKSSGCAYLDISHPEIYEFLTLRKNMGNKNVRAHNIHTGIRIPDKFMRAVLAGEKYPLISPSTKKVLKSVVARDLFIEIVKTRLETGSPFIFFSDTATKAAQENNYINLNERIAVSNLCTEICIKTRDENNKPELGVCCLGSVNAINFDKYITCTNSELMLIHDILYFFSTLFSYTKNLLESKANLMPLREHFVPCLRDRNVGCGVFGYAEAKNKNPTLDVKLCNFFQLLQNHKNEYNMKLSSAIAPTSTLSRLHDTTPCLEQYPREKFIDHNGTHQRVVVARCNQSNFQFARCQMQYISECAKFQKHVDQAISCVLHYEHPIDFSQVVKHHVYAWQQHLKTLYYCRTSTNNRAHKTECKMCIS